MRTVTLHDDIAVLAGRLPSFLLGVPSMLSEAELLLVHNLARYHVAGHGLVVDGGAFLGGSATALGHGLRRNAQLDHIRSRFERPIRSYEMGLWLERWAPLVTRYAIDPPLAAGDSFEPHLRRNIEPVADLVDLRIGDILQSEPITQPIELLFLDILKTPAIADFAVRHFFPRLLPGVGIIVEQDYFTAETPWLSRVYEHFADHFDYLGEVQSTAVWRCRRPISAEDAEAFVTAGPGEAESLRLADAAMARTTDPNRRFMLAIAKLQVVNHWQGPEAARDFCRSLPGAFPEQTGPTRWRRLADLWREFSRSAEEGRVPSY
jgi:hypothetical protein